MGLVTYDKREVILKAIISGLIYYKNKFIKDSYILFDEKIREIGNAKSFSSDKAEEVIHLKNQYLLPGFIDVHIHGIHGNDAMDSQENTLDKIARDLVKHGVTSFVPTTMTVGEEKIHQSLNYIGREMKKRRHGYILNMSSMSAWIPYPGIGVYASSKRYLKNFSRALRSELLDYHVSVTAICPGAVATNLYNLKDSLKLLAIRLGVMMRPETLARKGVNAMFRRRSWVLPGLVNKIWVPLLLLLPPGLVRWLMRHTGLLPVTE